VYASISTHQNCGLPESSNNGGILARLERSTTRELCLCQPGPEGLVRTWKLYRRLQPIAGA
jgi:hypothetical protein